ncbi:hypothetical protein HNP33_001735 [Comamonas odontotermitis]|uniref:Secreted protein n=1 Tax=Comamonas odontotermitis TaxID=379895 RepID=A0ABR6RF09_9BURK|nr:hypothetical protein [Comamonas odontotermitis]MBB6577678.1 hypothetical protein [Comamonas odontotermitis]
MKAALGVRFLAGAAVFAAVLDAVAMCWFPCINIFVCQTELPSAGYSHANGKKRAFQGRGAIFCLEMLLLSGPLTFVDGLQLSIKSSFGLISINNCALFASLAQNRLLVKKNLSGNNT